MSFPLLNEQNIIQNHTRENRNRPLLGGVNQAMMGLLEDVKEGVSVIGQEIKDIPSQVTGVINVVGSIPKKIEQAEASIKTIIWIVIGAYLLLLFVVIATLVVVIVISNKQNKNKNTNVNMPLLY